MDDPVRNPFLPANPTDQNSLGGGDGGSLIAQVRIGQIITFALVQGVILIGAVITYLALDAPANPPPVGEDLALPAIGVAVAVSCWIAALVVPSLLRRKAAFQLSGSGEKIGLPFSNDAPLSASLRQFLAASQTATLVRQAALEGAAVANLILMLVDGNWIHLPLAVVCLIGIALQVPTTGKLQKAIEDAVT